LFFTAVLSVPNTHRNSALGKDHPDSSLPQEGSINEPLTGQKHFISHMSGQSRVGYNEHITEVLFLEIKPSSMDLLISQVHQLDRHIFGNRSIIFR